MAARFQRLETSEDITTLSDTAYSSTLYDEPQRIQSPDSQPNPFSGTTPNPYSHKPQYTAYSNDDQRRMSYTTRKPVPQSSLPNSHSHSHSQSTTPDQPLISHYPFPSPSPSLPQEPPRDQKRSTRASILNLTRSASSLFGAARTTHVSHIATPLWAAPWRHQPCADLGGPKASSVRAFSRLRQRNRIFCHFFLQWLVPLVFSIALVGTLYFYSSKSKINRREKYIFNSLMVGFSLCLGFAVINGMKEYANIIRWRLLAGRFRSLQEFELLLGIASQKKALRLLWVGRTEGRMMPNGTQILCFCYLTLMLGLQLVIALLGLCYSVDTSIYESNTVKGNVSIASLNFFQQADFVANDIENPYQLQSGAINAWGIAGQRFGANVLDVNEKAPQSLGDIQQAPLRTDNKTSWWYWMLDACPEPECTTVRVSSRRVSAQAKCDMFTVTSGGYYLSGNVTYRDLYGAKHYIPYLGGETSATTTYYANTEESCGDRCTTIYVLNVGYYNNVTKENWRPQIFECNNTISHVEEPDLPADSGVFHLPDTQARLLAGAIGYNGASFTDDQIIYQTHTYDIGSLWSWTRLNGAAMTATEVANNLMHFSMGAMAALDFGGPRKFVQGDSPIPAQVVEVKWRYAIVVLILVPGVQFLVLMVSVIWGNAAIVRDGSYLSTASLLNPIMNQLQRTGCALTGDEICEMLGNPSIAYGVRMPNTNSSYVGGMEKGRDDVMHLDIIGENEASRIADLGWRTGTRMPQGRYDGLVEKKNEGVATGVSEERSGLRKRRKSF